MTSIWKKTPLTLTDLNQMSLGTISEVIGIKFTEISENSLTAEMPVDERTFQPARILHGGASVVLAETLGSVASNLCLENENQMGVGLEINANHIRSVSKGKVIGKVTPIHIGRKTHVWEIKISDEAGKLTCISRLTVAVIEKK